MDDIFKISNDEKRANALKEMAEDRLSSINSFKEPYRIIEEYYEIIKELITSFMYKSGFKTLSHKALVEFASKNIKSLTTQETALIDELRIKRNNIVYYGEKVSHEFLKSRQETIKIIINKLMNAVN
ncbi:MAG: hypothetical protein PHH54_00925 [Candidatus Nanoarchaeia archaeon]|nr:hypothetical protein [Candidatus Nanoarchaeia archaeon]MDD5740526.1 hypothetical protein [Candidatus Nanoarchaeia archaeon]